MRLILRRIKDTRDVIGFLPDIEANKGMIMSYMMVGQHGEASIDFMKKDTIPAKRCNKDAESLYQELQSRYGGELKLQSNTLGV